MEEITRLAREQKVDLTAVIDEPKNFSQSLLFQATIIRDPEVSFKMIKLLVELGVSATKEDTLKQTPLFYAAR